MNTTSGRAVAIGVLALAAMVAGCEPSPTYGPQAAPYAGVVYGEDSIVTTGLPQLTNLFFNENFDQYQVVLSLPERAYSSGTRVVLRLVGALALASGDDVQLEPFLVLPNQVPDLGQTAIQVLPATPEPAMPLRLGLLGYDGTSYDVLHANECDAAWQVVGTVSAVPIDDRKSSLALDITGPGLWTIGQKGDGGTPAPATPPSAAGCATPSDGGGQ